MPEKLYQAFNGPAPSTAAQVAVTTGTAIKTLMQLSTPSSRGIYIVEWGISFDGSSAATPIKCELLGCTGAATVTGYNAADVVKLNNPTAEATVLTLGNSNSGYTASNEGTAANVRELDVQYIAPTSQYWKQFPLGREPACDVSTFVRVRVTAAAAVNAYCYVMWGE